MSKIDYLFIFILIYFSTMSFLKGFINEILTIFSWFISFYLLKKYCYYLFYIKKIDINHLYFKNFFLIFFYLIFILILGCIIKNYLNIKIKNIYIKNINQFLGLFFGLLKGFLIIIIILYSLNYIDKNFYNYIFIHNKSLLFIIFNNILQKYEYFL
ncbi:hypothetical protein GJT99_00340 [Enterobacteriaceae endosymbiont of Donacia cincticornis]|uniref:CvpA family protein n=1 Tax=Enterobacteriaceae endosymbiont of Donacia cincticornis TaxID=2675773 RepID=UPI001449B7FC|nr:CvpA family protein [Enterobacteriaceae endosymbiont of Donacia cincticornis]QJC35970.1 hypothetical protein GJT99_00340 [Enterobacteriaceae endosymbiont of Donacia cincticornis]